MIKSGCRAKKPYSSDARSSDPICGHYNLQSKMVESKVVPTELSRLNNSQVLIRKSYRTSIGKLACCRITTFFSHLKKDYSFCDCT